jgi:hypothetical protein
METHSTPDGGVGRPLFGPRTEVGGCGTLLCAAEGEEIEIRGFGADGNLVRISRISDYDLSLSQSEIDAEITRTIDRWGGFEGASAKDMRYYYEEVLPRRETRAAFSRLLVDRSGNFWFGQHRGDPRLQPPITWEVLSLDRGWLATAQFPDEFEPLDIGEDYVLGVLLDRHDVETIVAYALEWEG